MSYFARLVRQAQLTIGEPTHDGEPAVDLVELDALVDAPSPTAFVAATRTPTFGPVTSLTDLAPAPGSELHERAVPPPGETANVSHTEQPPVERAYRATDPPALETQLQPVAMVHRVLDWVRAGNEQLVEQPRSPAASAPTIAVSSEAQPIGATPPATLLRAVLPVEPNVEPKQQLQAHDPPAERDALIELAVQPMAAAPAVRAVGEPRPPHHSAPVVEEVVDVSIGTINIRIEAPAPPVRPGQPAPLPPVHELPAPARRERPGAPRLARYYLQP